MFAYWKFFSVKHKNLSALAESSHSHAHSEEHAHQEESIIPMSLIQMKELGIELQEAKPGVLSISLSARGRITLHPDRLAHILPKVSGVAKEARKNIGDEVQQNEILAVIESREIADIKANYLAALEKEELSLALLEREKRLYDKKISAEQDYLNAKSAYEEAKINVQLGRQKLYSFGLDKEEVNTLSDQNDPDLRIYKIRAPIDGIIINRHITKGEFIESTSTIYEIADLSKVWVEIGIYPKDILKVKKGQTVQIELPEKRSEAVAEIIYVSPIVQDETITSKVVAELLNKEMEWKPGTFVQVNIGTKSIDASIVIPKEAIQEINDKSVVFVKIPEGFEKKEVRVGREDKDNVEILSGLNLGEKFASTKTFLLKADLGKSEAEHEH